VADAADVPKVGVVAGVTAALLPVIVLLVLAYGS